MSLSSEVTRNQVTADGVATVFNYTFKINDEDHLDVYSDDTLLGTGYTVTGVLNPSGGTVVFSTAPDNGTKITMVRNVPYTQPTTYPTGSKFPAQAHEGALDYIVMQNQQQQDSLGRSLTWPVTVASGTSAILPDPSLAAGEAVTIANDGLSITTQSFTPGGGLSVLTTKGDLATFDTGNVRLPVGPNPNDQLRVNPSTTTGLEWVGQDRPYDPIINGDMVVAQRGTSFVSPASNVSTLDRWKHHYSGAQRVTITQDSSVPTISDADEWLTNSLKVEVTTTNASLAASEYGEIEHRIEGYRTTNLYNKPITISFWVRSSKTGTYCLTLAPTGNNYNYIAEYTIDAADTWEHKTISLTMVSSAAGGTWDNTTGTGLKLRFGLAWGSAFHGTKDVWGESGDYGTSNQTNLFETLGATWYLTSVQIDYGSVAKPFRKRPFAENLWLCQRYYQKSYAIGTVPGTSTVTGSYMQMTSTNIRYTQVLAPSMRAAPSITLYSTTGAAGNMRDTTAGSDVSASAGTISENSFYIQNNIAVTTGNHHQGHWTADAEL